MTDQSGNGGDRKSVTFHYLKAPDFRTIHVDGVIGGGTPQGSMHMSFWAQRPAIPREVVFEIEVDGKKLGKEQHRVGREGIVRELQIDAMLSIAAAKEIRDWLTQNIERVESEIAKATSERS